MLEKARQLFFDEFALGYTSYWGTIGLILIILLISTELGRLFGSRRRARHKGNADEAFFGGAEIVLPACITLLSLILGFVFGHVLSWENRLKVSMTEEVLALGTAFNMVDLVDDPGRSALKQAIYKYADAQLLPSFDGLSKTAFHVHLVEADRTKNQVWETARVVLNADVPDPLRATLGHSINDALDAGGRRRAAMTEATALSALGLIVAMAAVTVLLVSMRDAALGRSVNWVRFPAVGLFWLVMAVIIDIDRPLQGAIKTNTHLLEILVSEMESSLQTNQTNTGGSPASN